MVKMFNAKSRFARYLVKLTEDALAAEGHLMEISEIDAVRSPLSDEEG